MDTFDDASSYQPETEIRDPVKARRPGLLVQTISIARRHRWVILASIVGALVIGLLATLLMTPQYTAVATIEIKRESASGIVDAPGAEQKATFGDQEFYETQYGLLQAQSLAERVALNLRLDSNKAFFEGFGIRAAGDWFDDAGVKQGAPSRNDRLHLAGALLLKHLVVKPVRLSQLVEIRFTSPDAGLSQRVVDSWTTSFIQLTIERRYDATSYARKFLQQRLDELRSRMNESERKLVDYASREGIINIPGAASPTAGAPASPERSIVADNLASANQELAMAYADRVRAQSRLTGRDGQVAEALNNQAITALRSKRAELASDYARMMVQFAPDYPPAKGIASQISQLDRSIATEQRRVGSTLQETYTAALEREKQLREQVSTLKGSTLDYRRRSVQYNILQRDVDTTRTLYDGLLQRFKEFGIDGGVGVNNVSVIDKAQLPTKPSSPRLVLNMLLAGVLGVVLGIGLALLLDQLDQGVSDPADVEALLGVPLLGTIPQSADGVPLDALNDQKSAMSEAYLSLRTNLSFTTEHGVPRSIAVTSTKPAEGKTTTSYALARSLARSGKSVLLLDADMRSPSIHHMFDAKNDRGVSNYLTGEDDLHRLISRSEFDNLSIMLAGPAPPSAAELLSGIRIQQLIEEATKLFDHVVIDAPPVMGLADAPLLSNWVEGTIFVLEAHKTARGMAEGAIQRLRAANGWVVGIVLAKFNVRHAHGYGYGYGYSYEYGDKNRDDVASRT